MGDVDWGLVSQVVQAVAAVGAIVVAIAAWVRSGRAVEAAEDANAQASRSANAAEETAAIDRSRHHLEKAPRLLSRFEPNLRPGTAPNTGVVLAVEGPGPYVAVTVTLLRAQQGGSSPAYAIGKIGDGMGLRSTGSPLDYGPLDLGEDIQLLLYPHEPHRMEDGEIRLLFEFTDASGETWSVPHAFQVRVPPPVHPALE